MKNKTNGKAKRKNSAWRALDKNNLVMANKDEDVVFLRKGKK